MCRHLAYIGPHVTLEELILEPEHSLLRQASAPRYQTHGRFNADGFGVGWYDRDARVEPARYRTTRPLWADTSFASFSGIVRANAVLAAVRSASPGMPVEETSTAPFTDGPWLFSHNGFVPGFDGETGRALRRATTEARLQNVAGGTDSELLFALVLDQLDAGASPVDALVSVLALVESQQTDARLNLLLTDGERIAATALRNSLFVLDDLAHTGAVVVASEPYDAATWEAVADRSVAEFDGDKLVVRPF